MAKTSLNKQEWTNSNFNDYIVPKYTSAPYTTIQNRAQVLDSSNMLQAVMGVERIPFKGINLLPKEFGANGETVYELESKDARVRFVGSGWVPNSNASGTYISTTNVGDFIEVSFYGTGINILHRTDNTVIGGTITVDNGSASTLNTPAYSNTLVNRNYNPNVNFNLTSGLSLGQHTIVYKFVSDAFLISGIEILNQSSSLTVPAGQAFVGNKKESLVSTVTSAYNAGISGTKGARVSKYLLNGVVSQAVRECAATPSYLTSSDHTNEEVARKIFWREFGANRSDDFSTLSTSRAAAFTLDDGTTTLVGSGVADSGGNNITLFPDGSFVTLTFIGTGLDMNLMNAGSSSHNILIDGSTSLTLTPTNDSVTRVTKICSGLPYGTHTVKFTRNSGFGFYINDFIIYQPKKPTLPVGAIEVADYNVMADYVVNTSAGLETIATGVLRKAATREFSYIGTWTASGVNSVYINGWDLSATATSSYMEYSFFGTGFELRGQGNTAFSANNTLSIDGSVNWSAFTSSSYGGWSITNSTTGIFSQATSTANGSGLRVSGLTLGKHTVRITSNVATNLSIEAFDIITPIHINHPTLKIGSLSLLDNAKIQAAALPVSGPDLSKAKAWVVFDPVNNKVIASYNVSQVLYVTSGVWYVFFIKPFKSRYLVEVTAGGSRIASTNMGTAARFTNDDTNIPGRASIFVQVPSTLAMDGTGSDIWSMSALGELQDE